MLKIREDKCARSREKMVVYRKLLFRIPFDGKATPYVKFNGIKCELNKNASFVEGRDKMGLVGSEACTLVLPPRYLPLQGTIMFWLKPLEDLRVSSSKTIVPIIKSKQW